VQKDITAHLFRWRKKKIIFFPFIHLNYICANTLSAEKRNGKCVAMGGGSKKKMLLKV
jgi:hypothetical protein